MIVYAKRTCANALRRATARMVRSTKYATNHDMHLGLRCVVVNTVLKTGQELCFEDTIKLRIVSMSSATPNSEKPFVQQDTYSYKSVVCIYNQVEDV